MSSIPQTCDFSSDDDELLLHRRSAESALSAASQEVKAAMKEAVTTSITEYRKIMDFFAIKLKSLFQRANFKGSKIIKVFACAWRH